MKTRANCRVCNGSIATVLSLGDLYVSNFLPPGRDDGIRAPLELALCSQCHLLQLKHTVPAEAMYRNYWYRSGTNETMKAALADITYKAEQFIHLEGRGFRAGHWVQRRYPARFIQDPTHFQDWF